MEQESYTCPKCGMTSYHPDDVKNQYCGNCHMTREELDEPNRDEFEHAGYSCLILRHAELGHLCGYVAVPKGHPCYGKDHEHMPYDDLFPVKVHGGLTFSREGNGDTWPEGYWWVGFDCAHASDLVPIMTSLMSDLRASIYKNFQYVRRETTELAYQVATLDFIDWQFTWVWPLLLPPGTARGIYKRRRAGGAVATQAYPKGKFISSGRPVLSRV